ncbi:DnaB Replicative DNA helicase [uncultured Caudovirales phage]|jgi:replicative DNA helicase|uniref:DnaB-like replicative helicase n=1 Tax=uncultured Caudovirales phage TaxID=2100421 RepID=A0A6J5M268_9CAUD|nr:DnaB Replicative DNA helicase [uncultured Caudovirales phage]
MFEQVIFGNLIFREDFGRKVIPFLKKDYFQDHNDKILFELIEDYVGKYNRFPTKEALAIDLTGKNGITDEQVKSIGKNIEDLTYDPKTELDWIVDKTEKYVQERAVYNAIMNSIQILDNKDAKNSKGSIPQILSDALGVSFDTNIGHNFIDDADSRYEFYHRKETRVAFNLDYFNKITKGGLPNKTLNIALAGTGVGKSLFMCHCASGNLLDGKNVLYITMEMAEERIAERIDANLMNVTMDELGHMDKETYDRKLARVKNKTTGKLIIKEYPTAGAGSANFRHLLNELKLKKNFTPDIIYIDYLNICSSSRMKYGSNINSYMYVKAIAEELRGLAVEFNVPIVSATQTTRSGYSNSDVGLEDTSESFGLPATADFMFALISSEELEGLGQLMVKQLKNRYNDPSSYRRFVVGVDRSRMKLYDVEQDAQEGLIDDKPVMDKSEFGERDSDFYKKKSKFSKKDFEGFA